MNNIIHTCFLVLAVFLASCKNNDGKQPEVEFEKSSLNNPNIIWFFVEDVSSHFGYQNERFPVTPTIDSLSKKSIIFENAYTTAPVCSPSRSAIITGQYPFSNGTHSHRSQRKKGKGGVADTTYHNSFKVEETLPGLLTAAGYRNFNIGNRGKTDYNFTYPAISYLESLDSIKKPNKNFIQIGLEGGKNRKNLFFNPDSIASLVPPYYSQDSVFLKDWSEYLSALQIVDKKIGQYLNQLKTKIDMSNTVIFFFSDHGVSHLRGKQFLYEEGIKIPLFIHFPNKSEQLVRTDLVKHIDISATTLSLAGVDIPEGMDGQDLFAEDYAKQDTIFSGRDRCDETVDMSRSLTTSRYKYIANFYPYRNLLQDNQYKNGKAITKRIRSLYSQDLLSPWMKKTFFGTPRPFEELYDLQADPYEMVNLVGKDSMQRTLQNFRNQLVSAMFSNQDLGVFAEPFLEDLGKKYGAKYQIPLNDSSEIYEAFVALHLSAANQDFESIAGNLPLYNETLQYWAITYLGQSGVTDYTDLIKPYLSSQNESVQIATSLAMGRLGHSEMALEKLDLLMQSPNPITRLYSILAIEQLKDSISDAIVYRKYTEDDYEFVKRVAKRF